MPRCGATARISRSTVEAALALEGVDNLGLTRLDHSYLKDHHRVLWRRAGGNRSDFRHLTGGNRHPGGRGGTLSAENRHGDPHLVGAARTSEAAYRHLGDADSAEAFLKEPMALIALLTDFGTCDEYVGVMKGVIAGIDPGIRDGGYLPPYRTPEYRPRGLHLASGGSLISRKVRFLSLWWIREWAQAVESWPSNVADSVLSFPIMAFSRV
jgi:hypothetical protein